MMTDKFEQRACVKFCMKLSRSATRTLKMFLQAFGEHSLGWTQVFEWHSHIKVGQLSVQDDWHSEWPVTLNYLSLSLSQCQKMCKKFVNSSMRTFAQQPISFLKWLESVMESARRSSQKTWPCCCKVCPWFLTMDQKHQHHDVCLEFHEIANIVPYSPCLPDLAPYDFALILQQK